MSVPRVLLLTGIAPGNVNVGRVYLRDLCRLYPQDRICCFETERCPERARAAELAAMARESVAAPPEHWPPYEQTFDRVRAAAHGLYHRMVSIPRLIRRAVAFGKSQRVEMVWAALHGPTAVAMALPVARALDVPLVTTVWDPPRYVLAQYRLDRFALGSLVKQAYDAIRSAVRCAVASEDMKRCYERDFRTECVVMIYGQPRPRGMALPPPPSERGRVAIGMAGAVYAQEEWATMLRALADSGWTLNGREAVVCAMAQKLDLTAPFPTNLHFLGWRNTEDMIRLLAQMDIAYVPYWFAEPYQEAVRLSFPGKLATYVAARLPVLYHGPRESSVSAFLERYPVGIGCHSTEGRDIFDSLERLAGDDELRTRARQACDAAYEEELNADVFRRRFAALIGVDEKELLRPSPNGPNV